MPDDTPRTTHQREEDDNDDRGSTVHGGGLGGNELGGQESAVGTVTENDLTPGQRRRSGKDVKS